jgi:hypothetical protein
MQFFSWLILTTAKPAQHVKTLTCTRLRPHKSAAKNHKKPTQTKTVLGMGWLGLF